MFNYRQPRACRMAHDQDNPCLSDEDYHRYELTDSMGISCGWCCDKCEKDLRSQYRPEIFGDSSGYRELMSEMGETIEPEDY